VLFKLSFLQGNYSQLGSQFSVLGVLIAGLLGAIAAALRLIALFQLNPKAVWVTLGVSALTALLFLVPFVVWTQNGIPYYSAAILFAGLIVAAMCLAGHRYLRRYARALPDLPTA
jgi:hypothetical protein